MPDKESNQDAFGGAGIAGTGERADGAFIARSCHVQSGAPGRMALAGARIATVGRAGALSEFWGAVGGNPAVTHQPSSRPKQYAVRVEIYKGESR